MSFDHILFMALHGRKPTKKQLAARKANRERLARFKALPNAVRTRP